MTNATYDLTGSGLPSNWGSNFNTKYDYASYYQFLQADTTYGSQYAESNIYTSLDSVNSGPTHQDLMSTNLALIGFLSGHVGDANESYVPTQGVNTTRLLGRSRSGLSRLMARPGRSFIRMRSTACRR